LDATQKDWYTLKQRVTDEAQSLIDKYLNEIGELEAAVAKAEQDYDGVLFQLAGAHS
jgi:hypothetical protein